MAFKIAQNIYKESQGIKSDEEIQEDIKNALRSLSWNNGESYIWSVNYNGILILGPENIEDQEGSSIIEYTDATGRKIIQEEIAICKNKKEGYLRDTFTKQNDLTGKQYEQVAYVKAFEQYQWYFGSSEYLDTAKKYTEKRIINLLKNIAKVNVDSYVFVVNTKGDILVNQANSRYTGKNIADIGDPLFRDAAEKIIDSVQNKETAFITYKWFHKGTNKEKIKYTFVSKIPNSDWIIGSGYYASDIDKKIMSQKIDMYDVMYKKFTHIVITAFVMILFSLIISYYLTDKLKGIFFQYKSDINKKNNDLKSLNESLEDKVEARTHELEILKNSFEELATIDALTQLHNRYSLMNHLEQEINRSHRYQQDLSLMILDIDYFKKVNDTYGHDKGDATLVTLAKILQTGLRSVDIAGRYGGEEFIIILPNTKLDDASIFAQRLRQEVQEHIFETVGEITISIGVAQLAPNESMNELFKRTDDLLYKSKNDGRNRVSYEKFQ